MGLDFLITWETFAKTSVEAQMLKEMPLAVYKELYNDYRVGVIWGTITAVLHTKSNRVQLGGVVSAEYLRARERQGVIKVVYDSGAPHA